MASPDLKVYTSPTCTWCQKLREWFKKRKLSFREVDIVENEKERQEMLWKTGQLAVPVIEVDGQTIIGFQEGLLEKAAGKGK